MKFSKLEIGDKVFTDYGKGMVNTNEINNNTLLEIILDDKALFDGLSIHRHPSQINFTKE